MATLALTDKKLLSLLCAALALPRKERIGPGPAYSRAADVPDDLEDCFDPEAAGVLADLLEEAQDACAAVRALASAPFLPVKEDTFPDPTPGEVRFVYRRQPDRSLILAVLTDVPGLTGADAVVRRLPEQVFGRRDKVRLLIRKALLLRPPREQIPFNRPRGRKDAPLAEVACQVLAADLLAELFGTTRADLQRLAFPESLWSWNADQKRLVNGASNN
jgi:hypothetical protein